MWYVGATIIIVLLLRLGWLVGGLMIEEEDKTKEPIYLLVSIIILYSFISGTVIRIINILRR